jgi:hypothetical protein
MASHRSKNWIWFFVVLGTLAVAAVAINGVYNLRQQLTQEELKRARQLWEKNGPHDYVMEYTKTLPTGTETLVVKVKDGVPFSVEGNVFIDKERRDNLYDYYGMDALFEQIGTFLKEDARPDSPRAFNRAMFDPNDGHIIDYLRSVSATGQRVHIEVKRVEPAK